MMSRFFVCFLLVIATNVSIAGIYKYTDEEGNVHFTDKPISGAKKIKENKPSVAPAPKSSFNPSSTKKPRTRTTVKVFKMEVREQPKQKPKPKAKRYKSIKIVSPEHDQAYRSNNGDVEIVYSISPPLQTKFKHKIKLVFDGKKLPGQWESSTISLTNLDRGTHTISAIVVDKKGKKLIQSSTTTFHLLRHSVLLGR